MEVPNEDQVASYYKLRQQLDNLGKDLLTFIQKPQYLLPFLQPGRLVKVRLYTETITLIFTYICNSDSRSSSCLRLSHPSVWHLRVPI